MIPALINLLVYIVVMAIVVSLVLFIIKKLPLDPAIKDFVITIVLIICALILILLLLQFAGIGPPMLPMRHA